MGEETAVATAASELGTAATELLGELIRFDTRNPPGDEAAAQEMLAARLGGAGFECEMLAAEPGRPNLIARLAGERDGPTLCLLGHVDVVPFDDSGDWSFHPLAGELRDGEVLGRGAQDMKGQVAAEVAAAVSLAASGWRPRNGDLLVVITADEEMGGRLGARWLCEEHPEKVRCEMVLNEGAGLAIETGGRRLYTLCTGEKGVFRFRLRTRGRAGHASVPRIGDNALLKLAELLGRFADQPPPDPAPEAIRFLEAVLGESLDDPDGDRLASEVARLGESDPALAAFLVEPMLGVTLVPTRVEASRKDNVIPAAAEALVDCRVPPERDSEYVRERIEGVLGPGDYEIEFAERITGNRSEAAGALYEAIADWVGEADPGARLAPMIMPGFSDSHWFRKELGATAFGFCPQRSMGLTEVAPLIHGADERVAAADVALAALCFEHVTRRVLG